MLRWEVKSTVISGCRRFYGEGLGDCNHTKQQTCSRSIKCKCGMNQSLLPPELRNAAVPVPAEGTAPAPAEGAAGAEPPTVFLNPDDFNSIEEWAVAAQDVSWWLSPCT